MLRGITPIADWKISLKLNVIVAVTALFSLILALTGIVLYDHTVKKDILAQEIYILTAMTAQRSSAALQFLDKDAARQNLEALQIRSIILNACLYDVDGSLFTSMENISMENSASVMGHHSHSMCPVTIGAAGVSFHREAIDVIAVVKQNDNEIGYIYVQASLSELKKRLNHSIVMSTLIVLSTLLGTLIFSIPFQKRLVEPLIALRDLAISISHNKDFSVRANIVQKDEIGDTSEAFNLLLSTIEKSNEELFRLAYFDPMTGLGNRHNFLKALELALVKTRYSKTLMAVIMVDVDNVRAVNERFGHPIGDLALISIVARIQALLPEFAILYRLGGDEFTIIMEHLESDETVRAMVEMMLHELRKPMDIEAEVLTMSASAGIALSGGVDTCFTMMKRADLALDEAKVAGKNGYRLSGNYLPDNH